MNHCHYVSYQEPNNESIIQIHTLISDLGKLCTCGDL